MRTDLVTSAAQTNYEQLTLDIAVEQVSQTIAKGLAGWYSTTNTVRNLSALWQVLANRPTSYAVLINLMATMGFNYKPKTVTDITLSQLANNMGMSKSAVRYHVKQLYDEGILGKETVKGLDKVTYWLTPLLTEEVNND